MTGTLPWRMGAGSFDEHPWVLLTLSDRIDANEVSAAWWTQGCEVFVCDGPVPGHSCPLVDGGACPVADRAHLVVNGLSAHPRTDALLAALADRHPDLPVIDLDVGSP